MYLRYTLAIINRWKRPCSDLHALDSGIQVERDPNYVKALTFTLQLAFVIDPADVGQRRQVCRSMGMGARPGDLVLDVHCKRENATVDRIGWWSSAANQSEVCKKQQPRPVHLSHSCQLKMIHDLPITCQW